MRYATIAKPWESTMGSVHPYTNAAGKRLYRIAYRRPDNKQTNERGFATKKAAELRLAEVEVSKGRGEYVDPADGRATVGTLAATWLAGRETVMKPSSYRPLKSAWTTHVERKWAARSVASIRHGEVQAWVSELSKARGATTVLRAHGVLASILDGAVKDRRVAKNVARNVSLPRKGKKGRVYLSHEQVRALADASRYPTMVLFLAYTGLRWGEATALRVRQVDSERRRVSVEENAVMVGSRVEVGTPKTHETRSVPYPAFLADALAAAAANKRGDALLFGTGKHMRLPNSQDGWFAAAVKRAQLAADAEIEAAKSRSEKPGREFPRVTPHDLRHTAASLAIASGANVKAVQRMLGHASAAMTLDTYADLFDDDLDTVAAALDEAARSAGVVKVLSDGER